MAGWPEAPLFSALGRKVVHKGTEWIVSLWVCTPSKSQWLPSTNHPRFPHKEMWIAFTDILRDLREDQKSVSLSPLTSVFWAFPWFHLAKGIKPCGWYMCQVGKCVCLWCTPFFTIWGPTVREAALMLLCTGSGNRSIWAWLSACGPPASLEKRLAAGRFANGEGILRG